MKECSAALQTHLALDTTTKALCWRITRADGTVHRYTDHDEPIGMSVAPFANELFLPVNSFLGSAINSTRDGTVSDMDVLLAFSDDAITETDVLSGALSGCEIDVFVVNWADTTQGYVLLARKWTAGQFTIVDGTAKAEIRSKLARFQQDIIECYSKTCRARLGDARCKLSLASYSHNNVPVTTVDANYPRQRFFAPALYDPDDRYRYGFVHWLTGANAGKYMEVMGWHNVLRRVLLFQPMGADIVPGDTFYIAWGCDGKITTCREVFNNTSNFRGEPLIPTPETTSSSRRAHTSAWDRGQGAPSRSGTPK